MLEVQPFMRQRQQQPQVQPQAQGVRRRLVGVINTLGGMRLAPGEWLLDTGAEDHLTFTPEDVEGLKPVREGEGVVFEVADGRTVSSIGEGRAVFASFRGQTELSVPVHVVPDLQHRLFSVKALKRSFPDKVVEVVLSADCSYIAIDGIPAVDVFEENGMYIVLAQPDAEWNRALSLHRFPKEKLDTLHRRMGHASLTRFDRPFFDDLVHSEPTCPEESLHPESKVCEPPYLHPHTPLVPAAIDVELRVTRLSCPLAA
ncbi:hypothetical protein VOLCADRAFT_97437 [Volvox carteri f. nagariensis]|uniref:Retrovirus-related Pol polyprotein from transposon TNT 1-94-like beta-barrel domain-containing protein n=1 Tax=Volvox carteri f. nagariensis TaxID=3068 RepID=D8UCR8_VOLCA|nr:uncharacterized protein VOLCADRAFT_97437 [Volvox carteri f. nagariensis]EFJ42390.1 hypothetical protein VOLCADRAFT_97437 [Volvox carteri f. nagariensis]|eukprot:XP_002956453.1 hypothetical protein VOLCADRAFT_97437 [Volvox carteri f. nagariensis]